MLQFFFINFADALSNKFEQADLEISCVLKMLWWNCSQKSLTSAHSISYLAKSTLMRVVYNS